MPRYIQFLLVFISVLLLAQPADARKRPNKYDQKRESSIAIPLIEPDPISRKTKPDSHPRQLEQPAISGGMSYHPDNYIHGIDVSHHNGRIDWTQVAHDSQVGFVFIKCSEGANYIDDMYDYNQREARRNGLKVGCYHFFRPNVSAEVQFKNLMSIMDVKKQDLLPIIDVEVVNGVSMPVFHARLEQLLKLVTQAIGRRPIIYTGKNFYNKYMSGGRYRDYKLMIAAYSFEEPTLNNNDDFVMWQYSASGRIKGIRGNVDQSRFVGRHTMREILW